MALLPMNNCENSKQGFCFADVLQNKGNSIVYSDGDGDDQPKANEHESDDTDYDDFFQSDTEEKVTRSQINVCKRLMHSCFFCYELWERMDKHLVRSHPAEAEVRRFTTLPTGREKRHLIVMLIRKGDYKYNMEVIATEAKKNLLLITSSRKGKRVDRSRYGPCPYCLGFLLKNQLWRHVKTCPGAQNASSQERVCVHRLSDTMMWAYKNPLMNKTFEQCMLKMRFDDIGKTVRSDEVIILFGYRKLITKGQRGEEFVRQKMRQLGRLVMACNELTKECKPLRDYLHPLQFNTLLAGVWRLCGHEANEDPPNVQKPGLALDIGHALKRCAYLLRGLALKEGDKEGRIAAEDLLTLLSDEWADNVSSAALFVVRHKNRNATELEPNARNRASQGKSDDGAGTNILQGERPEIVKREVERSITSDIPPSHDESSPVEKAEPAEDVVSGESSRVKEDSTDAELAGPSGYLHGHNIKMEVVDSSWVAKVEPAEDVTLVSGESSRVKEKSTEAELAGPSGYLHGHNIKMEVVDSSRVAKVEPAKYVTLGSGERSRAKEESTEAELASPSGYLHGHNIKMEVVNSWRVAKVEPAEDVTSGSSERSRVKEESTEAELAGPSGYLHGHNIKMEVVESSWVSKVEPAEDVTLGSVECSRAKDESIEAELAGPSGDLREHEISMEVVESSWVAKVEPAEDVTLGSVERSRVEGESTEAELAGTSGYIHGRKIKVEVAESEGNPDQVSNITNLPIATVTSPTAEKASRSNAMDSPSTTATPEPSSYASNFKIYLSRRGRERFICKICDYETSHSKHLKGHMTTHTGEKRYACDQCDYKSNHSGDFKKHILIHSGERPIACDLCDYKCSHPSPMKVHKRSHTGEKPYVCSDCGYECNNAGNLKKHARTHTGERPYACEFCNYKCNNAGDLRKHIRTHTGEKPHACDVCDYKCNDKGMLKRHARVHTGEKPYSCSACTNKFAGAGELRRHMRTHSGEKPHACDFCDYKSIDRGNLKRHLRHHTGEKPFSCSVCDYKCTTTTDLKRHMRIHSGEKPFECDSCDYKSTDFRNFKRHVNTVHTRENPFACNVCDYKASRRHLLTKHVMTHTSKTPFMCST